VASVFFLIGLFFSIFFLSPQLLTATLAVVFQFFFFFFSFSLSLSFSVLIFFVLFCCPRELLLTKFNLIKIFSILTYPATHVANYCPYVFFLFFFLFLMTLLFFFFFFYYYYWMNLLGQ
jgi:hypothetical protein